MATFLERWSLELPERGRFMPQDFSLAGWYMFKVHTTPVPPTVASGLTMRSVQ
jgi:hypothetical protein